MFLSLKFQFLYKRIFQFGADDRVIAYQGKTYYELGHSSVIPGTVEEGLALPEAEGADLFPMDGNGSGGVEIEAGTTVDVLQVNGYRFIALEEKV